MVQTFPADAIHFSGRLDFFGDGHDSGRADQPTSLRAVDAPIKFRQARSGGVKVHRLKKKLVYLLEVREDQRRRDLLNWALVAAERDANGHLLPRKRIAFNFKTLATAIGIDAPALSHAAREKNPRPLQLQAFQALCSLFALEGLLISSLAKDDPDVFIAACEANKPFPHAT